MAKVFNNPNGEPSGFLDTYFIAGLPPGSYRATVYRRAPGGWIACVGKQALVAP